MRKNISLALIISLVFTINIISIDTYADTVTWQGGLFMFSSGQFNRATASVAAEMCDKAQGDNSSNITDLLRSYGFDDYEPYYYGESYAFVLGYDTLNVDGEDTVILTVVPRGSTTPEEFLKDFLKWPTGKWSNHLTYSHISDFASKIWTDLNAFVYSHSDILEASNLKIFVAGHSLGGATAGLIAARFNDGVGQDEWWSNKISREDIHCYTFGAIKTVPQIGNIENGYENIHNIYNYYDSFGKHGNYSSLNASSEKSKFGHTDVFKNDKFNRETNLTSLENHSMTTYKDSLNGPYVACKCKKSIGIATISKVANKAYTGKEIKPNPIIRYNGRKLTKGKEYTLSYKNNKKVGTATITVKGKGDYSGSQSIRFRIIKKSNLSKFVGCYINASGAGAWYDGIKVRKDGSFVGHYQDWDGYTSEDDFEYHPNGVYHYSDYHGTLKNMKKIDKYTYSAKVGSVLMDSQTGDEYTANGTLYIAANIHIEKNSTVYVYLKGKPRSKLSKNFISWATMAFDPFSKGKLNQKSIFDKKSQKAYIGVNPQNYDF